MDPLSADALPWLGGAQRRMKDAWAAGRMPHSTLLLSAPGLGAERFAAWMAGLALCDLAGRPCGSCPSCSLLRSDSHPDLHVVRLEDDAKQIKVDQVRGLIGDLELKSYRGGYKIGIIEGAETLNANGANAFLKSLEEPAANTLLIMVARPTHRLPATIASRCTRVTLSTPPAVVSLAWLAEHGGPGSQDWRAALALAGGAPLLALEYHESELVSLEREMHEGMRAIAAGQIDITVVAEQWARTHLALRIAWLENWITRRVYATLAEPNSTQSAERVRLPDALLKPKIRSLFELLDGARNMRRLASTSINQQLALEALLLGGRNALASDHVGTIDIAKPK